MERGGRQGCMRVMLIQFLGWEERGLQSPSFLRVQFLHPFSVQFMSSYNIPVSGTAVISRPCVLVLSCPLAAHSAHAVHSARSQFCHLVSHAVKKSEP